MRDHILPEEKLLRLIRGQKKVPSGTAPRAAIDSIKPQARAMLTKPRLLELKKYLTYLNLNRSLLVIFILAFVYLTLSLLYPLIALRKIRLSAPAKGAALIEVGARKAEVKPFEYYQQGVGNRQIFGNSASTLQSAANISPDLMKDMSLIGVIAGDRPQAIIEDRKAQKTYYLNRGQYLGEFQLDQIEEGKVILNYNGQRFELHL